MRACYYRSGEDYLFYKQFGTTGEPLLLLHGNGEDHQVFRRQISFLSRYFQVTALDTRGHGRSDHGKDRLSFSKIAEDILLLLDRLALSAVTVIGFSDGGNIGLYLASHYPDSVKKLVIIGANLNDQGMEKKELLKTKALFAVTAAAAYFSEKGRKKREVLDLMLSQLCLSVEDLRHISIPVLVIAGERDVIRQQHIRQMSESLINSRLEIIEAADHFLIWKRPERVNAILQSFLLSEAEDQKDIE